MESGTQARGDESEWGGRWSRGETFSGAAGKRNVRALVLVACECPVVQEIMLFTDVSEVKEC